MCQEDFDLVSPCWHRTIVDALSLLFVAAYCLSLIVACFRRTPPLHGGRRRDRALSATSICCAVVAAAHFAIAAWTVSPPGKHQVPAAGGSSLAHAARGVAWAAVAVSLHARPTRRVSILASRWWASSSVLASALNLEDLVRRHGIELAEAISWPVDLMLLFCFVRVIHPAQNSLEDNGGDTEEPLLVEGGGRATGLLTNASLFDRITFSWLSPLLRRGYSKPLGIDDIPELDEEDGAGRAYKVFARAWELQRKKDASKTSNLALFALARCYATEMLPLGFYALLNTLSVVAAPLLLQQFVQYSTHENRAPRRGFLLVGALVAAKAVESLSRRHWYFGSRRCGMRMRSALMAAVFQKVLILSSPARGRHSTGEIVNYIAVDAYRLGEFPRWFHMAWCLPLELLLSVAILFGIAGAGAFLGMVPLLICGIINVPFGKVLQKCQQRFMVAQGERLRATSEVLNSMKIIKLHSWEEKFRDTIEALRDAEFKWLKEAQINKCYGTAVYWMSPTIVSAAILAGCAVTKSAPLNASTIFTVLATLRVISEPMRMLPEVLSAMIQVRVSLDRLDVFLLEDEIKESDTSRGLVQRSDSVGIQKGAFSWDPQSPKLTLSDIDLKICRGQKVAVCGPVGAGKSSLLYAMLGELPKVSGSVEVSGTVAYVSQTPWIQSGTIRDNILFGKPMNKKRYEACITSCALDKDIQNFDYGDLTEIGQRGINMSGGQKQRIQLARAVFSSADIYLLDDPFSAVDAHTAATLFNDCVMTLLAEKTVILVTHQIEFLKEVDSIVVMEGGQVTQAGSYLELLKSGTIFQQLAHAHQHSMTTVDSAIHRASKDTQKLDESNLGYKVSKLKRQNNEEHISTLRSAVQLTEKEEMEIGYGGWKPYRNYVQVSRGLFPLSAVAFTQLAFVLLQMLATYWLAAAVETPHISKSLMIGIYAAISAVSCLFTYLRSWWTVHLGLRASKEFFSLFMDSFFKAPMLFFDSTPVGRILTRASSDMSILDFDIPFAIAFALAAIVELSVIISVMAIVTWQVLIAAIPVLIAVTYLQRYYLASARELVRMNGTTKAPVMNYASETFQGVITIRAFAAVERFIESNVRLINTDAMLFFHTVAAMDWVLIRVEALQILTILTATVLLVLLPQRNIAPGFVGLSLTYALILTSAQVFLTRWYSSLDNYIISVERIKQFMHLQSEASGIVEDRRPPPSWPREGRVNLQNLKIRYSSNGPLVLKGVTCTFSAGKKIGVVGRTGSGKTTLISALFRLTEPAAGTILIDDLDICSIGLKDLRMKLSIIPQEPTMFKGSVRNNLDPLGQHSDNEIWEALDKCQLRTTIGCLAELLDFSVCDEGENWSVGQRQLFCLGRVLLRRNKILVLDEATASIDSVTDATLQRIIQKEFSNCTVITVAHRIPTVLDSDMVMVLSYGNMVEYDTPSNLMDTNSSFSKLVADYWSSNCRDFPQNRECLD